MIAIREATSDDDLEAWRRVRLAVLPYERAPTVAELRRIDPPQLLLLAELDGEPAGSGTAGRSDTGGGFVAPRVLPGARRRGVGTALLRALAAHLVEQGYADVRASADDPGSVAFAERFGFREVNRQVEQVRTVGDEPPAEPPPGIEIVSVAERPELWRAAYDPLALQAFADMDLDTPLDVSLERWEREWLEWPEGTFLALDGGSVVGCAGLLRDADEPRRAENALTAVRRDRRGEGIAIALKRHALAFAAAHDIREVYTWTQRGNGAMRALNERLGYVTRTESVSLRAPLPLP